MNLSELVELIEAIEFSTIDMNNSSEIIRKIMQDKSSVLLEK